VIDLIYLYISILDRYMYIYTYMYMYTHTCIQIFICWGMLHASASIYTTTICVYTYIHIHIYVYSYTFGKWEVHEPKLYRNLYMYTHTYIGICICIHIHIHRNLYMYTRTYISCIGICVHVYTFIYTFTYTYGICVYIYTYIYTFTYTYMREHAYIKHKPSFCCLERSCFTRLNLNWVKVVWIENFLVLRFMVGGFGFRFTYKSDRWIGTKWWGSRIFWFQTLSVPWYDFTTPRCCKRCQFSLCSNESTISPEYLTGGGRGYRVDVTWYRVDVTWCMFSSRACIHVDNTHTQHTHIHAHTHTCVCAQTQPHVRAHARAYTHTYTHTSCRLCPWKKINSSGLKCLYQWCQTVSTCV